MKNLISTLILGAGLTFGSLNSYGQDSSQKINSLKKFTNVQAIDFNKDKKVDYILFKHNLIDNGYVEMKIADRNYDKIFESKTASIFDKMGNIKELEIPLKYFIDSLSVQNWIKTINEMGAGEYNIDSTGKVWLGFEKIK